MKRQTVWLVVSCLMVLALLVTSCTKAEEKAPALKEVAPALKEVAPALKEAAPAVGENMVKLKLTKNDGTVVEKLVEKPKYGGVTNMSGGSSFLAADYGFTPTQSAQTHGTIFAELLVQGDWTRGPMGTEEYDFRTSGYYPNPLYMTGGLAESWEFPDNTTIIYHIRKGVRYGLNPNLEASRLVNGRELTADDVVFNIRRIFFDMKTSTPYIQAGPALPTDVYATDENTVVVKNPPRVQGFTWEYVSAYNATVPPEVIQKYGDMKKWETNVGSGAFIKTDEVAMSSATFVRNQNYWMKDPLFPENQLPYLDGIRFFCIPDVSTRLAALRTGKIDRSTEVTEDALSIIKTNPKLLYIGEQKRSTVDLFGFRVDKPELPFDDIRVRRAMNMGVNRQEILDTYYGGKGSILNYKVGNLPHLQNTYTPLEQLPPESQEIYTYNPEKARQLLAEAGYPAGFSTEVVIRGTTPIHIDLATMLAAAWAKIGITLKLDIKEQGAFLTTLNQMSHKEGLVEPRYNDQNYAMRSLLTGCAWNWSRVSDPYLDEIYPKMTEFYFDTPKREAMMKELNKYIISKAYYVVLPQPWQYTLWWPWVKNYRAQISMGTQSSGMVYKYIWIDQELKKSMGY